MLKLGELGEDGPRDGSFFMSLTASEDSCFGFRAENIHPGSELNPIVIDSDGEMPSLELDLPLATIEPEPARKRRRVEIRVCARRISPLNFPIAPPPYPLSTPREQDIADLLAVTSTEDDGASIRIVLE